MSNKPIRCLPASMICPDSRGSARAASQTGCACPGERTADFIRSWRQLLSLMRKRTAGILHTAGTVGGAAGASNMVFLGHQGSDGRWEPRLRGHGAQSAGDPMTPRPARNRLRYDVERAADLGSGRYDWDQLGEMSMTKMTAVFRGRCKHRGEQARQTLAAGLDKIEPDSCSAARNRMRVTAYRG